MYIAFSAIEMMHEIARIMNTNDIDIDMNNLGDGRQSDITTVFFWKRIKF